MGTTAPPLKRARTGLQTAHESKKELSRPLVTDNNQGHADRKAIKIHECSFIKWHVSGITSVAATPSGRYLAVARSNGTVELRDKNALWATISVLYAKDIHQDNNITGMAFSNCGRYLFAAYLLGIVDILRLTPGGLTRHTTIRPGGGAIWDITVNRSVREDLRFAIACDDGCVRIIAPDLDFADGDSNDLLPSDPVHYDVMATEKSSARVLSVCWSPASSDRKSECIVCGDEEGGVRWLNPSNGVSFGRGKIPTTRGENAMIWTLQFVSSGREVICGDSRGLATVWSSATNTMTAEIRIEAMRGSLWSSALVRDKTETEYVILGGANGGIGGLKRGAGDSSWTPLRAVQLHTHDVRSICHISDDKVLSGSVDALMRTFTPTSLITKKSIKWIRPYNECVGQPSIQFCPELGIMLARMGRSLELWSLSEEANQPSLLLRMNFQGIIGELRSCAISRDCRRVAVSAADSFKLYQIWDGDGKPIDSSSFGKVTPLDVSAKADSLLRGCIEMSFGDGVLACLTPCRQRIVFLSGDSHYVASVEDLGASGSFLSRLSCLGDQVAVSDTCGHVYRCRFQRNNVDSGNPLQWDKIFSGQTAKVNHITAIAFSDSGKRLAISTISHRMFVLDLESNSRKEFDLSTHCSSVAHNVSFSRSETSVLISGQDFCVICKTDFSTKRRKRDKKHGVIKGIHVLPYKDSIIGASIMGPSRIAVVRRSWQQVLSSLSDAIPKKVYGT